MTKAELIDRIARSRDLPPDVTKKCIAQVLDLAVGELAGYFARAKVTRSQNPRFTFPGFGSFTKKKRSARKGVHPRTLEPIQIDASYTIDFRPSGELREAMNGSGGAPKKRGRSGKNGKSKRSRAGGGRATAAVAASRRRSLTPREDVELEELMQDSHLLEGELPQGSMKRARPDSSDNSRTGTR